MVAVLAAAAAHEARSETPADWIALGARIHGGFGAFIPVGIRIGEDALARLEVGRREVAVVYYHGAKPPCPCVADGVMLATQASPGQGILQIAAERAPDGVLAAIEIRSRKTGAGLRYTIADDWLPRILGWNQELDAAGRFNAAMTAEGLFEVTPLPAR